MPKKHLTPRPQRPSRTKFEAACGLTLLTLIITGIGMGPAIHKVQDAKKAAEAEKAETLQYAKDLLDGKGLPNFGTNPKDLTATAD